MLSPSLLLTLASIAAASITIDDPSNTIPVSEWASDNAILADYDITTGTSGLLTSLKAAFYFDDTDATISHETLTVDANDTSVISVAGGADVNATYITVLKEGYSSNLNQASFYGVNAAVNVANASTMTVDHVNVTVHNGAANFYAYGTDSIIYVDNAWLYSSGPVSHGLYASGNGTIYANNIVHFSGGNRASSFAGDSGGGYIIVTDAVAHTTGIGSAIAFALGVVNLTNVVGYAENAPIQFMDANQEAYYTNCDLTGSLLGGLFMFSSSTKSSSPAYVNVTDSKITVVGSTVPAIWAGNTYAIVKLYDAEIVTDSGILAVSNYSQTTQAFDYYASYVDNNDLSPATLEITVEESTLVGDLVAYNGSTISWGISSYTSWTGAAYAGDDNNAVEFAVSLDSTSNWTLTKDTTLQNFTDDTASLTNIFSNGYNILYNASSSANSWLGNQTISLTGGGSAKPL